MSQVIVYRDEHILFAKDMYTMGRASIRCPLDYWVCKAGLIVWVNQTAPALLSFFDEKKASPQGTDACPKAMLITLYGEIFHVEVTIHNGFNPAEEERYSRLIPTGPGVSWVHSLDPSSAEKADGCMVIGKTLEEVKSLMITADITMAKTYDWYKMEDLVKEINVIHKKKYPGEDIYNIPKALANIQNQINEIKEGRA